MMKQVRPLWPVRDDVMLPPIPQAGASGAAIADRMRGRGGSARLAQTSAGVATIASRTLRSSPDPDARRIAASALSQRARWYQGAPPTMEAAPSLGLQRQSGGTWVSVSEGGSVRPNETVRLIAAGLAPFKTVKFWVASETEVYLEQIAHAGAGGGANTVFAAPTVEGLYVALLEVDGITQASLTFRVSADAPPPPPPPPGGDGFFGNIKTLGFIVLGIVAVSTIGPAIGRLGRRD